jgi:hypothetical protein
MDSECLRVWHLPQDQALCVQGPEMRKSCVFISLKIACSSTLMVVLTGGLHHCKNFPIFRVMPRFWDICHQVQVQLSCWKSSLLWPFLLNMHLHVHLHFKMIVFGTYLGAVWGSRPLVWGQCEGSGHLFGGSVREQATCLGAVWGSRPLVWGQCEGGGHLFGGSVREQATCLGAVWGSRPLVAKSMITLSVKACNFWIDSAPKGLIFFESIGLDLPELRYWFEQRWHRQTCET